MPYKNIGPTISKHMEKNNSENNMDKYSSPCPISHIKQVFLPWCVHEISWIKYKMTINPATNVQIILNTRFHFFVRFATNAFKLENDKDCVSSDKDQIKKSNLPQITNLGNENKTKQ